MRKQEGGSQLYNILASCIRVWRRGIANDNANCPSSELCCQGVLRCQTQCSPTLGSHGNGIVSYSHAISACTSKLSCR